jgi:hypothetical protein
MRLAHVAALRRFPLRIPRTLFDSIFHTDSRACSHDASWPATNLPDALVTQPRVQHDQCEPVVDTLRSNRHNDHTLHELLERGHQLEGSCYYGASAMGSAVASEFFSIQSQ